MWPIFIINYLKLTIQQKYELLQTDCASAFVSQNLLARAGDLINPVKKFPLF